MAWATHARCLHCGVRLPLFRQLSDGQFCSAAHRAAFQQDQSRLAIERLMETQAEASRAAVKVRHQIERSAFVNAPPQPGPVRIPVPPRLWVTAHMIALDPIAYEFGVKPKLPRGIRGRRSLAPPVRGVAGRDWIRGANWNREVRPIAVNGKSAGGLRIPILRRSGGLDASWDHAVEMERGDVPPFAGAVRCGLQPSVPFTGFCPASPEPADPVQTGYALPHVIVSASAKRCPRPAPCAAIVPGSTPGRIDWNPIRQDWAYPRTAAVAIPEFRSVRHTATPAVRGLLSLSRQSEIGASEANPRSDNSRWVYPTNSMVAIPDFRLDRERLLAIPEWATAVGIPLGARSFGGWAQPGPVQFTPARALAGRFTAQATGRPDPAMAGVVPFRCFNLRGIEGFSRVEALPVAPRLLSNPSIPAFQAPQRKAARIRLQAGLAKLRLKGCAELPSTWSLKSHDWCHLPARTTVLPVDGQVAVHLSPSLLMARKIKLPVSVKGAPGQMTGLGLAALRVFEGKLILPEHRLILDPLPVTTVAEAPLRAAATNTPGFAARLRGAPMHIRLMAVMLPLLTFMALRPGKPVEAAEQRPPATSNLLEARLVAVRSAIQNRAGVEMVDDFRSGLDNWENRSRLDTSWSYDQTGFVRPGPLALFRPSMHMSDYEFEFLGQIDRKAISWVYRAQDLKNYHVARIVILQPGPLPKIGLVRYSVINGRETRHIETTLPHNVRQDTVYRVRLEARGDDFALYIQNQIAGSWTDSRLSSGGIGFFSPHGEQSRIRWIQISYQNDTIGRLCAYFSPVAMATYNPSMGASKE